MDFGSIAVSALIGGISVGGAVLLFGLISKSFPENQRQNISKLGLFIGIAIMVFAGNWYRDYQEQIQLENVLAENQIFQLVKQLYPNKYETFAAQIKNVKDPDEAERLGFNLVAGIRRNHADNLLASAPEPIRRLHAINTDLLKLVSEERSWQECNAYLEQGGAAVQSLDARYSAALEEYGSKLLKELEQSEEQPVLRGRATDEDWVAFTQFWQNNGATENHINAVSSPDFSKEETCNAFVSFYNALGKFQGAAADRILTEITIIQAKS